MLAVILTAVSLYHPSALSDSGNEFLKGFINQELLATLGFVASLSIAAAGTIHIELGKLAARLNADLDRQKWAVRASAYLLLWQFLAALVLVIVKPILPASEMVSAFANAIGVMILVWAVAVLYDLVRAAFMIDG